jgi:hypothetical protein
MPSFLNQEDPLESCILKLQIIRDVAVKRAEKMAADDLDTLYERKYRDTPEVSLFLAIILVDYTEKAIGQVLKETVYIEDKRKIDIIFSSKDPLIEVLRKVIKEKDLKVDFERQYEVGLISNVDFFTLIVANCC